MGILNAAIVRPVGGLLNAQLNSMQASAGRIAGLARALTVPPPAPPHVGPADPRERFQRQARQRGYASAEGYDRIQRQLYRVFLRYFVAAVLLLCLGIVSGAHGFWLLNIVPAPLACLILCIRPAFYQFQLRQKSALPFKDFVRRPSEWLPVPEPLSVGGATKYLGILMLLLLLPGAAWAQSAVTGTSSNLALNMLNSLIPVSTGNSLTAMIAVMSASLMFAGTGMIAYHGISAVANAAHDGVAQIGVHTMWSPIQILVGFCMLAPVKAGGIDLMQVTVYEVAKNGSATADSMWTSFVDNSLPTSASSDTQNQGYITSDMLSALTITRQAADLELCSAVHSLQGDTVDAPLPAVGGVTGTDSIAWDYGSCGSMTMPLVVTGMTAQAANTSAAEIQSMTTATTDYQNERHAALTALVTSLRADTTIVEAEKGSIANSGTWPATVSAAVTALTGYAQTYDTAMQAAATAYLATRDGDVYSNLKTDAANLGWMAAGSYWRTLSQTGTNLSQLQSASPDFGNRDGDNYADVSIPTDEDAAKAVKRFDMAWAQATAKTRLTAADLSAGGNRSGDVLTRIAAPMMATLGPSLINLGDANSSDPESTFITLGHNLTLAGTVGIAAGTIISAATGNAAGKIFGAGSAWDWLSEFAKLPIEMCFVLGVFLSYVLPMLPWIAVLWLIVGWATLILEALIAAPLYALLFIRCDGKEFIGGVQTPGFVILFSLWCWPSLGIAGLGGAFYLLPLLSNFLTSQFADGFIGQQGGHITGLFGILTGIGMLVWLQFMLTLKTLELVHIMPQQIPRWLGSALGGSADGISESSNRMYAAISSTSSKAMGPAGKAMEAQKPSVSMGAGSGGGVSGEEGGGGNSVSGSGGGGAGGSVTPRSGGSRSGMDAFDGDWGPTREGD